MLVITCHRPNPTAGRQARCRRTEYRVSCEVVSKPWMYTTLANLFLDVASMPAYCHPHVPAEKMKMMSRANGSNIS
jgi:hypothetical protein